MTKKQGIHMVLFLVLIVGIVWWLDASIRMNQTDITKSGTRRFREMYTDTENTWDGILLGSSYTDRAWAAPAAFEEQGIAVYPLSTDDQPFILSCNIIEEVLKRQNLSFVVVELHNIRDENYRTNPEKARRVLDNLKRSANWLDAISVTMDYLEKYCQEVIEDPLPQIRNSFYFPIMQFHSRLTQEGLNEFDFHLGKTEMKGVYEEAGSYRVNPLVLGPNENYPEPSEWQKEVLDRLFAYAEEKDFELVFLNVPTQASEEPQNSVNAAARYAKEHGYRVFNSNEPGILEAIGMDGNTDFGDGNHMNAYGARKFTSYFAQYLKETLNLTDHRGDARYQSWEDAVEKYEVFYDDRMEIINEKIASRQG